MTEAEWVASEDPAAMLQLLGVPQRHASESQKVSDRKLRLWVEAVRHRIGPKATWANRLDSPAEIHRAAYDLSRGRSAAGRDVFPLGDRAALLRDIAGTPHRPVLCRQTGNLLGTDTVCIQADGSLTGCDCQWLTPTVVSLAHLAYDRRDAVTGHLDPVTLAAVADELEVAGCPQTVAQRETVSVECEECHGAGQVGTLAGRMSCTRCSDRYGVRGTGKRQVTVSRSVPHPILAHLRSPGPHVRGCWAIDLLTGRE